MSWDPVTGRMRLDPDPRAGDRRPRWSDIEARIASGEQLPPQSEWVGGPPWETLFGESGSMPDIPIGGPWGGTTAPVFPPGPIGTNQTEPIVLTEPGTVGPAGTTIDPVQDAVDQAMREPSQSVIDDMDAWLAQSNLTSGQIDNQYVSPQDQFMPGS